ncbi:MAG: metallophosphoesterase [Acidobacteria bacterium]|nr:metallophosphoesterase [Acidobacteriota bacterium]
MKTFETHLEGPLTVIGDLHGQHELLQEILDQLTARPDFDERWLIFMGDFLDRGRNPKKALDLVMDIFQRHPKSTAVMGNHDLAIAGALDLVPAPASANWASRYIFHYHSRMTFHSYGVIPGNLIALKNAIPPLHQEFLADLPWCLEHPRYFIVHAGLRPDQPFREQLDVLRHRDFSLNRPEWLCERSLATAPLPPDCPYVVISGHVRQREVVFSNGRILLDTSGGRGKNLSAVLLPEQMVISA